MNVLSVVAHHDDFELGMGGTAAHLVARGHRVTSLVMTDSGYRNPAGAPIRDAAVARAEAEEASALLGVELVCLEEDTLDLAVSDRNIAAVLRVIEERGIDAIFTHWHGDTHPPHQNINRMVLHASRKVPRVLGFQVNWHLGREPFRPHVFVAIDDFCWQKKLDAYHCYRSETDRAGEAYERYHEALATQYGLVCGARRAEAFFAYKLRWDFAEASR